VATSLKATTAGTPGTPVVAQAMPHEVVLIALPGQTHPPSRTASSDRTYDPVPSARRLGDGPDLGRPPLVEYGDWSGPIRCGMF
jgi:hypothetical protein